MKRNEMANLCFAKQNGTKRNETKWEICALRNEMGRNGTKLET